MYLFVLALTCSASTVLFIIYMVLILPTSTLLFYDIHSCIFHIYFHAFMYIYLQRPYVIFFYSTLQLFHYNSPLSIGNVLGSVLSYCHRSREGAAIFGSPPNRTSCTSKSFLRGHKDYSLDRRSLDPSPGSNELFVQISQHNNTLFNNFFRRLLKQQ